MGLHSLPRARRAFRLYCRAGIGLLSAVLFALAPLHARQPEPAIAVAAVEGPNDTVQVGANTLHWVPADAVNYFAMLRNREQAADFLAAEAFQGLPNLLDRQELLAYMKNTLMAPTDDPQFKTVFEAFCLAGEALSEEIFYYEKPDTLKLAELGFEAGETPPLQELMKQMSEQSNLATTRMQIAIYESYLQDGFGDWAREQVERLRREERRLLDLIENRTRRRISACAGSPGLLVAPTRVAGFKLQEPDTFLARWDAIEDHLRELLDTAKTAFPDWENPLPNMRKVTHGEVEYRVLDLDGFQLAGIDRKQVATAPLPRGEIDGLTERLAKLRGIVAIGVRNGYLLVVNAPSLEALDEIGKGPSLFETPEFARLRRHAESDFTLIGYRSLAYDRLTMKYYHDLQRQALLEARETIERSINQWTELMYAPDNTVAEQAGRILDLVFPIGPMDHVAPPAGAALTIGLRTETGSEFFTYDDRLGSLLGAQKPLTITDHFGGQPLFAAAWRVEMPKNVEWLVPLAERFLDLEEAMRTSRSRWERDFGDFAEPAFPFEEFEGEMELEEFEEAEPEIEEGFDEGLNARRWRPAPAGRAFLIADEAEELDESQLPLHREQILQYAREVASTTEKHLLPALADGQHALVVTRGRRITMVGEEEIRSFVPEFSYAVGVSDPAALARAGMEYRNIFDRICRDAGVPQEELAKIPAPEQIVTPQGILYRFTDSTGTLKSVPYWSDRGLFPREEIPEGAQLDDRYELVAGLGQNLAVVSTSLAQARSMLAPTSRAQASRVQAIPPERRNVPNDDADGPKRQAVKPVAVHRVPENTLAYLLIDFEGFVDHYLPPNMTEWPSESIFPEWDNDSKKWSGPPVEIMPAEEWDEEELKKAQPTRPKEDAEDEDNVPLDLDAFGEIDEEKAMEEDDEWEDENEWDEDADDFDAEEWERRHLGPPVDPATVRRYLKLLRRLEVRVYLEDEAAVTHTRIDWGDKRSATRKARIEEAKAEPGVPGNGPAVAKVSGRVARGAEALEEGERIRFVVAKVSGRVTLDGKPLTNATVIFTPIDKFRRAAHGTLDAEGRFQLSSFQENDGAMPGRYRVEVIAEGIERPADNGRLPLRYAQAATSPLTAEVVNGNNVFHFELKSE